MNNNLTCAITGSNGYVGSKLRDHLHQENCQVVELCRRPETASSKSKAVSYSLGDKLDPAVLAGCDALVHCAYDMKSIKWDHIKQVNVDGTSKLLNSAKQAGVKQLVLISSISAYEGCSSLYGKAKLLMEKEFAAHGGTVIRPGLVYGETPGGMVGKLSGVVSRAKVIPVVGGSEKMYLCHEQDLAQLVFLAVSGQLQHSVQPITAACAKGMNFSEILHTLAQRKKTSPLFVPIPWQCAWLGLKVAELAGLSLGFKSDSLVSLVSPNPNPDFSPAEGSGVAFRSFV